MLRNRSSMESARWMVPSALFFAVAWLLTFDGAYVNGDDVVPMARLELRNAFVPNFKHDWVPNRMLDAYGRDLLAAGFDLWFFSLRTVVPVDFFVLFKAYVATVHAAFLTTVLCYLQRTVGAAGACKGGADRAVVGCFLAVVVLGLFPWRNQTHFVAYQLAAFLCFVLLNEVTLRLVALGRYADRNDANAATLAPHRYPQLILLSFVCAFSLEAYAAIVLLSLLLPAALVLRAIVRDRQPSSDGGAAQARLMPVALVLLVAIAFCTIAIVVTLASSERADVLAGDGGPDIAGLGQSGVAWLSSRRGVIAVLLCAVPIGIAAVLGRLARRTRAHASGTQARDAPAGRDPQPWLYLSATGVVVLSSVLVTILVSIRARHDYFSHASYPWGALLIVAKIFATCALVMLALGASRRRVALRGALLLLAFIAASKGALDVLGSTHASHRVSERLHAIYRSVEAAGGAVDDSGLDLASIPMQTRPLPTQDSPAWFVAAFERFFEKYYGASGRRVFR